MRSTKRPTSSTKANETKRQKREKEEDSLLQKAMQCMEAATSTKSSIDADKLFGDYIASELKAIEDEKVKRLLKHQIQSLIFTTAN